MCCAALLAFSYAGAWHPAGDSFAVFRLWIAAGLAALGIVTIALRAYKTGLFAVLGAVISAGAIVPLFFPLDGDRADDPLANVIVYSKIHRGAEGMTPHLSRISQGLAPMSYFFRS